MEKGIKTEELAEMLLSLDVKEINKAISLAKDKGFDVDALSDGWHTFKELYEFRKMYNACLFNEWVEYYNKDQQWHENNTEPTFFSLYSVHKSWKHEDGEYCFGKEKKWFIVSAKLPGGLISNHYKAEDWDLFNVPEVEKALFKFDGHTGKDVLDRLKGLCKKEK